MSAPSGGSSGGSGMPRLGPAWRSSGAGGAGRGFQPPPAVPDEKRSSSRERSGSMGSSGGGSGGGDKNRNPFAMLGDEDGGGDNGGNASNAGGERNSVGGSSSGGGRFANLKAADNNSSSSSRIFHRASSAGSRPGGRSLADLAAGLSPTGGERSGGGSGAPERHHHRPDHHHRGDHHHHRGGEHDHHRPDHRSMPRSSSTGVVRNRSGSGDALAPGGGGDGLGMGIGSGGGKVIRYTREKLLSLRGRGDDSLPDFLKELEGSVVLSKEAQDPVCWDTFDADEIWAQAARDRRASPGGGLGPAPNKGSTGRLRDFDSGDEREVPRGSIPGNRSSSERGSERGPSGGFGGPSGGGFGSGGRWQRGVALPEGETRPSSRGRFDSRGRDRMHDDDYEASDPDDLWDDPGSGGTGAAADFSAFGGLLDDDRGPKGRTGMDAFELSDMSKAAAAFESELHGDRKSDQGGDSEPEGGTDDTFNHHVDPSRPLASSGTTIRGGSGDDVNVFEDFGDETGENGAAGAEDQVPIKSGGGENPSASSRLMKMIGVAGTGEAAASGRGAEPAASSAPVDAEPTSEDAKPPEEEPSGEDTTKPRADSAASIPSNPWGAPASSVSSNPWGDAPSGGIGMGMDSFGQQKQQATNESDAQRQREQEMLRQKQQREEEEKQRWAAAQKQQAEMQAKQQEEMRAAQQRQQEQLKAQQSQVELVLVERISNILENSWGRSDLNSILSTLHANDSRVIAILSTVEALRALIARHPQRIQLGRDPTMGAEMAALRLTNAQWQSQQAQVAAMEQARRESIQKQEAEMQRQRQLQEEQARQQQEAMARAQQQREAEERKRQEQAATPTIMANAPWYYADPQGNIQGPFAGDEMRQWLEAGYFKNDLPISQNAAGPFRRLGSYFTDSSTAFQSPGPTEEERAAVAEAQARAEAEARAQALRQQQHAESEAKARAKAEADAQEAAKANAAAEEAAARQFQAAAEANARAEAEARAHAKAEAQAQAARDAEADRNQQSSQLKMMLGLGAGADGSVIAGPPQPEPVQEQPPATQPQPTKKGKKKQQQQAPLEPAAISEAPAPQPAPAAPPAPAWGGAAASTPVMGRKKSMSEIQQEEAREAARRAKEQGLSGGGGQRPGGGWANIAATGGSTAWGGAAAQIPAAAMVAPMSAAVAGLPNQKASTQAAWNKQAQAMAPSAAKKAQGGAAPSNAAAVDNFGANGRMAPALETWCRDQMRRLNGSDDLTLVSFCMTLTDSDEIRQYLAAYLGATPAVNNFATEFIGRKGGDNGKKEEEWESAGGSKKGRKKKQGK